MAQALGNGGDGEVSERVVSHKVKEADNQSGLGGKPRPGNGRAVGSGEQGG
jgi:hypothetical protein